LPVLLFSFCFQFLTFLGPSHPARYRWQHTDDVILLNFNEGVVMMMMMMAGTDDLQLLTPNHGWGLEECKKIHPRSGQPCTTDPLYWRPQ